MNQQIASREVSRDPATEYEVPSLEVISLSCEISSYAPDGDDFPLF